MTDQVTISLSIMLGFASVALGICGLVLKSDCDHVDLCYGMVKFRKSKKQRHGDCETEEAEEIEV